jgi:HSP20 family protein
MHDQPKRYALFIAPHQSAEAGQEEWQPRADVYRASNGWILKFDLAGVRPEEITVGIGDGSVTVSGVRRDWVTEEGWSYYSMEISYSRFLRTINVPGVSGQNRYRLDYRDGILLIRIESL